MTPRTWKAWAVYDTKWLYEPSFSIRHEDALMDLNSLRVDVKRCGDANRIHMARVTVTELPRKKRKAKGK